MGIQGLLPALKSTMSPVHIRQYAGKKAAVDTYCWLHKAAFACSKELCEGILTTKYIDFCMHRVNLLRHHGVKPLLVFDGGLLPIKEDQEAKRARARKENLERAREHEMLGNQTAAYDCYQKAVDITPLIAYQLIKVLRNEGVEYIVAPYEADAQMAFLSLNGHVEIVITEDSDLIPFGCPKVLFKMDKFGQGVEFQYSDLVKNRDLNFTSFTKQMVLEMCILSGCDYLPSLQGMGVKRAYGLIRRFRNYQKVIKHLRYNGVCVPSQYDDMFMKALLTFRHQRVYDPVQENIVHLTEVPLDVDIDSDFLGPNLAQNLAQGIAEGHIDPITGQPFEIEVQYNLCNNKGSESKAGLTIRRQKRQLDLPIQKNLLTKYYVPVSEEAKKQFKAPRISTVVEEMFIAVSSESEENGFQVIGRSDNSNVVGLEVDWEIKATLKGTRFNEEFVSLSPCSESDSLASKVLENMDSLEDKLTPEDTPFEASDFVFSYVGENESGPLDEADMKKKAHINPYKTVHAGEGSGLKKKGCLDNLNNAAQTVGFRGLKTSNPFVSKVHTSCVNSMLSGKSHGRARQENCSVRSAYFSRGTSIALENSSGDLQVHPKSIATLIDRTSDDTEGSIVPQSQPRCAELPRKIIDKRCSDTGPARGGKSMDFLAAGKSKHVPSMDTSLLGMRFQSNSFASNLSHIEKYATIAHDSVERFVSAIAPFRCTSGARASGLSRLKKSNFNEKPNSLLMRRNVADDLDSYVYISKKCRQLAELQKEPALRCCGME